MTDPPIRRRPPLAVLRSCIVPALLVPTALLAGACSGGGTAVSDGTAVSKGPTDTGAPGSTSAAAAAVVEVDLRLVAFVPATVEIPARGTVRWVQRDPAAHTVTSGTVVEVAGGVDTRPDGVFDSARLEPGAQFEFTPDSPGSIPYFCRIHPATMRGVVTVR